VHLADYTSGPEVTVQLSGREPSAIAAGLLAWADTLTDITTQAWRVPDATSIHLSVSGLLPDGTAVQVYGGLRACDLSLSTDLEPGATITVTLATLRHLATPGQVTEESTL
jgi:hypothetical protein